MLYFNSTNRLKRYVFHESGILVMGIIGGLYSSTATIAVLARKSRGVEATEATEYVAAMLMAVSMMFLRFLILAGIFSREALRVLYPYLLGLSAVAAAWWMHRRQKQTAGGNGGGGEEDSSNPLEFKVALIFAALFVVFTLLTHYVLMYAETGGLNVLSVVAGLSDVTPFVLNLLQGTGGIEVDVAAACCLQAMAGNVAVNLGYAWFFCGKGNAVRRWLPGGFGGVKDRIRPKRDRIFFG